jgi:hypothetical protein
MNQTIEAPLTAAEYIAILEAFTSQAQTATYTKRIAELCEAVSTL